MKKIIYLALLIFACVPVFAEEPIPLSDEEQGGGCKVAHVNIIMKTGERLDCYLDIQNVSYKNEDNLIEQINKHAGDDITSFFKDKDLVTYTKKYYDIPGLDKIFASESFNKIKSGKIESIRIKNWENFNGYLCPISLPEKTIQYIVGALKKGVKPVIYNEYEEKYVFIPIKISYIDLDAFVSYWMRYHISTPGSIFCEPGCRKIENCEESAESIEKDIDDAIARMAPAVAGVNITEKRIAAIVKKTMASFSDAYDFFIAIKKYFHESDVGAIMEYTGRNCTITAAVKDQVINGVNDNCGKITAVRGLIPECKIGKRSPAFYEDFIELHEKLEKEGYYIRYYSQISAP